MGRKKGSKHGPLYSGRSKENKDFVDYDYVNQLSQEEWEWLRDFTDLYYKGSWSPLSRADEDYWFLEHPSERAELGNNSTKAELRRWYVNERNARRRDVYSHDGMMYPKTDANMTRLREGELVWDQEDTMVELVDRVEEERQNHKVLTLQDKKRTK